MIPAGSTLQGKYGDVTLKAEWSANEGIAYIVKHIYEGLPGQADEVVEITLYGEAGQPANVALRPKVGFSAEAPDAPKISSGLTIEITYTRNQHTVTWDPNNGGELITQLYLYGQTIVVPDEPESDRIDEGYQFAGWNGYAENMTMPDGDITFTALYAIELYAISFNSNGGSEVSDIKFAYNATVDPETLPRPTKEGYTFIGWYYADDQAVTEFKMPAQNITLFAKWEQSSTSLKIQVAYPAGADYSVDEPQTFLFTVKSNETGETVDLTVTVQNNGSVKINGLIIGHSYTVTMHSDWSWRYEVTDVTGANADGLTTEGNSVTFTLQAGGTLTFHVSRENDQWLDFSGWLKNLFG